MKRQSVQRACGLDTIVKYLVEFKKNKSESWFFEYFLIKQKSIRSKRCPLLKMKLYFKNINIRCSLFDIRYSLFKKRFINSVSKTDTLLFFIIPYFFHCQKSIKKSRTFYFYLKLFVPSWKSRNAPDYHRDQTA
jgi:hypothetical protein